jgi:hypothetical protein
MFDFEDAFRLFAKQTVLCVGDLMLDDFVYGEVSRISPEAPTPVLAVARSEIEIGGAASSASLQPVAPNRQEHSRVPAREVGTHPCHRGRRTKSPDRAPTAV